MFGAEASVVIHRYLSKCSPVPVTASESHLCEKEISSFIGRLYDAATATKQLSSRSGVSGGQTCGTPGQHVKSFMLIVVQFLCRGMRCSEDLVEGDWYCEHLPPQQHALADASSVLLIHCYRVCWSASLTDHYIASLLDR